MSQCSGRLLNDGDELLRAHLRRLGDDDGCGDGIKGIGLEAGGERLQLRILREQLSHTRLELGYLRELAVLRLVPGRSELALLIGLRLFAFFTLEVQNRTLSLVMDFIEVLELMVLLMDGVADGVERSLAILSLLSPTFSALASVHERSTENMMDGHGEEWKCR